MKKEGFVLGAKRVSNVSERHESSISFQEKKICTLFVFI